MCGAILGLIWMTPQSPSWGQRGNLSDPKGPKNTQNGKTAA